MLQSINLSQSSLSGLSSPIAETKIPLWCNDGTNGMVTSSNSWTVIGDGNGNVTTTLSNLPSEYRLFKLSTTWSASTQFAFEASVWGSNVNTQASAALIDATTGTVLTATKITGTGTTSAQTVRSGNFTLTPGHEYAVGITNNAGTTSVNIADALLIVFP